MLRSGTAQKRWQFSEISECHCSLVILSCLLQARILFYGYELPVFTVITLCYPVPLYHWKKVGFFPQQGTKDSAIIELYFFLWHHRTKCVNLLLGGYKVLCSWEMLLCLFKIMIKFSEFMACARLYIHGLLWSQTAKEATNRKLFYYDLCSFWSKIETKDRSILIMSPVWNYWGKTSLFIHKSWTWKF